MSSEQSKLNSEPLKEQTAGEYLTPYQTTVIYDPNDTFATAVAFLSNRAQLVPLTLTPTDVQIAALCEYVTPEVLVLTSLSDECLVAFIERGFQFIHILELATDPTRVQNPLLSYDKLVRFTIDDLFDHLILVPGLCASHLLEYIICAVYPMYKSNFLQSAATKGKQLLAALEFSGEHLGKSLLQLCSSPRGFDDLATLITKGEMLSLVREKDTAYATKHGVYFKLDVYQYFAVNSLQTDPECSESTDYVLQYAFESHLVEDSNFMGWRLILNRRHEFDPSAIKQLLQYSEHTTGNDNVATCWLSTTLSKELMPFIYGV